MAIITVSRRVNAERVVLVGWLRALLLQLAHPLIAAGVSRHSTFRGSPRAGLSRLGQTIDAMLAICFGSDVERERALDGIRAIHRRVNGRLEVPCGAFDAGTRYSAEDPALVLWVHVTLVESVLLSYMALVAPLSDEECDQCCAESADVAIALGAPPDAVPRSWHALRAHIDERYASGEIAVGPEARALAAALLAPFQSWLLRATLTPLVTDIAAVQLPTEVRRQYGLASSGRQARRGTFALGLLRQLRRIAPQRIAWWKRARLREL